VRRLTMELVVRNKVPAVMNCSPRSVKIKRNMFNIFCVTWLILLFIAIESMAIIYEKYARLSDSMSMQKFRSEEM